jgi:hypothetical protein
VPPYLACGLRWGLTNFFALANLEQWSSWSPPLNIYTYTLYFGNTGVWTQGLMFSIDWDGVLLSFIPGWPWTAVFLISASQITGLQNHCTRMKVYIFKANVGNSIPNMCLLNSTIIKYTQTSFLIIPVPLAATTLSKNFKISLQVLLLLYLRIVLLY